MLKLSKPEKKQFNELVKKARKQKKSLKYIYAGIKNLDLRKHPQYDYYAIVKDNKYIGLITLYSSCQSCILEKCDDPKYSLDYWLLEEYQGKGLGKEALLQLINMFPSLGACTAMDNIRSIKVLESVGFKQIRTQKYFCSCCYIIDNLPVYGLHFIYENPLLLH